MLELANKNKIDLIIGNKDEYDALGTQQPCKRNVITAGACGAWALWDCHRIDAPKIPIKEEVVSSTGAGDAFAGGFLFGLNRGFPINKCLEIAAHCSVHVIQRKEPFVDRNFKLP